VDNFFTSIPLPEELLRKHSVVFARINQICPMSCKYKVVGLRSHLCLHLMVMVTHTPVTCQTKGEKIMLLSTMHHDDRKPLRVLIYNELNSSVDGDYYWFACSVGSERQMANGFVLRV